MSRPAPPPPRPRLARLLPGLLLAALVAGSGGGDVDVILVRRVSVETEGG